MTFNTDVNLGNLITIASFIVTIYTLHRQNIKRIESIDFKVGLMWKQFSRRFDLPNNLDE